MMDPVSIIAGVATLLGVAINVGNELDKFRHDMSSISSDMTMLIEETTGLREVLESMTTTFARPEITDTFEQTGHIGGHWANVSRSLKDTEKILTSLLEILSEADKTTRLLDAPRKLLRYRMVDDRVRRFTGQICSCKATLQLCLQTMSLWEQVKTHISMELAITTMDKLDNTVRIMARDIASRLDTLEKMQKEKEDAEVGAEQALLSNLHECVRSSSRLVSSASTVLSSRSDDQRYSVQGSVYGETILSTVDVAAWITNSRAYGSREGTMSYTPSVLGPASPGLPGATIEAEKEDSDVDLDNELVRVLLKRGHENMQSQQYAFAEQNFRGCLKQLEAVPSRQKKRKRETQKLLIDCLMKQGKYYEVQTELRARMAHYQSREGKTDSRMLGDMEILVEALRADRNYVEAQLFGRRLLTEFRALGVGGYAGVERSLQLLVSICRENNDVDEAQVYSTALAVFLEEKTEQPLIDLSCDFQVVAESANAALPTQGTDPMKPMVQLSSALDGSSAEDNPRSLDFRAGTANAPQISSQERPQMHVYADEDRNRVTVGSPDPQSRSPRQDVISLHPALADKGSNEHSSGESAGPSRPVMGPFVREGLPKIQVDTGTVSTPRSNTPTHLNHQVSPISQPSPSSPRFSWQSDRTELHPKCDMSLTPTDASSSQASDFFEAVSPSTSATMLSPVSALTGFSHSTPTLYSLGSAANSQETIGPRHRRTRSSSNANKRKKLLCLGDPLCGKTALLSRYAKGAFHPWMSTTTFENYVCTLSVASEDVEFAFYDTNGSDDYDTIRSYSYAGTDIVLLCFAINLPYALLNVEEKWVPEIKRRLDGLPFILVGTMADQRRGGGTKAGQVTYEKAEAFAERVGALRYFETSASTGEGVKELFEYVALQSFVNDHARSQRRKSFSGMLRKSMQNLSLLKSP